MGTLGGKESEFRVLWVSAWGPAPALFSTSKTGSGSPSCSEKGDSQAELGCLSQRAAAHKGFQPQHGSHSAQPGAGGSLQRRQQGEVCRQCLCVRSLLLRRFSWDFSVGEIGNPSLAARDYSHLLPLHPSPSLLSPWMGISYLLSFPGPQPPHFPFCLSMPWAFLPTVCCRLSPSLYPFAQASPPTPNPLTGFVAKWGLIFSVSFFISTPKIPICCLPPGLGLSHTHPSSRVLAPA